MGGEFGMERGGKRRPRAGGFGVAASPVTSPTSQQSSLQTKFTASRDGPSRAGLEPERDRQLRSSVVPLGVAEALLDT